MMNVLDRLKQSGVVPVVVLDEAKDAVATAKAACLRNQFPQTASVRTVRLTCI